jgi:O-antigen ligase/polysaccharide polymerase Wzy-like membrane protein
MGKVFLILLLMLTAASLLYAPWISGAAYFFNSLLQPQYLWSWIFEGIPIFTLTAGLAILGFAALTVKKELNWEALKSKQSLCLILIWIWMHLSNIFTPYPNAQSAVSPEVVLATLNSIVIMYFVLVGICNKEAPLIYFSYIFVAVGFYYLYWTNSAYISQSWHLFLNGRLRGPWGSPYKDENNMATLLVMCLPFILLSFFRFKNKFLKFVMLSAVPLTWHSLILVGSRGGLLATLVVIAGVAYIMKSKKFSVLIFFAFTTFMVYQGSLLLDRTTETFSSEKLEQEKPINPRLVSWSVAVDLIPMYPIFGVGVEKYQAASRAHFPGKTANVAHNTFLNFSANAGLLAGILFLIIVFSSVIKLRWIRNEEKKFDNPAFYALSASSLAILGFFICSIFLDLIIFEPFYLALVLNIVSWRFIQKSPEK